MDNSGAFSKGDKPLIKDVDKLLAISDEEFSRYTFLQRSNLLVRFAGVHCSDLHCPGMGDPSPPGTNVVSEMPQGQKSSTR